VSKEEDAMTKPTKQRRQVGDIPNRQFSPASAGQHRDSAADAREIADVADVQRAGIEDVRRRAYVLYCERGRTDGYDVHDWCQAERDVLDGERER
jgi:hypothetical protein